MGYKSCKNLLFDHLLHKGAFDSRLGLFPFDKALYHNMQVLQLKIIMDIYQCQVLNSPLIKIELSSL